MPNHVFNFLTTHKPLTAKVLHEQSKDLNGGLAMLVMPRPTDQEENWYAWNCNNWGTKWGCYEQTEHDGQIDFTTAWDRLNDNVLDRFAKHFPNMTLYYEEEQEWGGEIVYKNGTQYSHSKFDIPPFTKRGETEGGLEVWYLKEDYQKLDDFYPIGWYYYGNLGEPVDASDKILNIEEY
tara:strand:+ start:220 stop:756 length:537 start_codon:yes stop_codon:yes gene_type:complete